MRPAFSLIVFTSLSGMGLGLAAMIGLGVFRAPSVLWWLAGNGVALGLITAGVLASLFHLGNPARAWRAFSQWRTSWLSREGVLAALVCFGFAAWTGAILIQWLMAWDWQGNLDRYWHWYWHWHWNNYVATEAGGMLFLYGGIAIAVLCFITVWATAMIYASLKTVARWHQPATPFMFIGFALAGGMMAATFLRSIAGGGVSDTMRFYAICAMSGAMALAVLWEVIAAFRRSGSSPESATGLGGQGRKVEMLMPPHSEENWLQHEMGFVVGRRHRVVLRATGFIFLATAILIVATDDRWGAMLAATLTHLFGVMLLRWLFFAEAKHTVMLYYGARH